MKNIHNLKNSFFFIFLLGIICCKSQTVYPLNTSELDTPTNSYFKDLNGELDAYLGTWTATFQGETTKLVISKELKRPMEMWNKDFFKDVLLIRFEIRNAANQVLQSSLNNNINYGGDILFLMMSVGTNIQGNNELDVVYSGGNCSAGGGFVYLKKISNNQLYWTYYPGSTTLDNVNCPPGNDYNIYLPETENLVFTKQ